MKQQPAQYNYKELCKAYFCCRKHKRSTHQALSFEYNLEENLKQLHEEIENGTYQITKSICFVVQEPKLREVWAGAFRDRIVHHLIYNAIEERFTKRFILDSFSCIPKRGTQLGILRAAQFARSVSQGYSKRAYYLKADIQNYFNSIDKNILYEEVKKYVDEEWLLKLIKQVIFHNPLTNYYKKSPQWLYDILPSYKSIFNTDPIKGLPIGNLTSQFFSNVYLNRLDQFVKHDLHCKYYCRYVDDIILFHADPGFLNDAYEKINRFLIDELALQLNHKKKDINLVQRGFDFIGRVNKFDKQYPRKRTVNKALTTIEIWKKNKNKFAPEELQKLVCAVNSYLGMFRHARAYKLRKRICEDLRCLFLEPDKNYYKIKIVNLAPKEPCLDLA